MRKKVPGDKVNTIDANVLDDEFFKLKFKIKARDEKGGTCLILFSTLIMTDSLLLGDNGS